VRLRVALLVAAVAVVVSVPAAAGAVGVRSHALPVTRLLCGCDLRAAARATAVAVSDRASTLSMSIVHVVRGCHVWALGSRQLGPVTTVTVKPGTRLKLRIDCPMDFDLVQVAGPRLALGASRFPTGSTRVIVFRKPGLYKIVARNVQTSDEVGLETLGDDNTPRLTIRVR
jgi:hypothetical protein